MPVAKVALDIRCGGETPITLQKLTTRIRANIYERMENIKL